MAVPIPSRITRIEDDLLWFRGYRADDLVRGGWRYEAVAELLWTGALAKSAAWPVDGALARRVQRTQAQLPASTPAIDRLRATAVLASALDEARADLAPASVTAKARRLLPLLVISLPRRGKSSVESPRASIADRLWSRLSARRCSPAFRAVLNAALLLLADHELATATVGARVAASTRADPYAVLQAALGVAAGALHGTASILAFELLQRVVNEGVAPDDALTELGPPPSEPYAVPGFGHVVYVRDPRAPLLLELLARAAPRRPLERIHALRAAVHRRTGLEPNVDFGLAALAVCAQMDRQAGPAIFAIARCAGWWAHALEEWGEAPLRFRLTSQYLGPRGSRPPGRVD